MQQVPQRLRIGEIINNSGLISEEQLTEALQQATDERLGQCLMRLGYINEDSLISALSRQLNLERIDLLNLAIPEEAIKALPLDFVKENHVIPLSLANGSIRIVTSDPANARILEDIRLLSGLEVEETLASSSEIRKKISKSYGITVERMIEDFHEENPNVDAQVNMHDIEVMANEPTVVNLVNLILSTALRERASDIHLVPFEKSLELRYRIDGLLQERPPPPKHLHAALISRIKIMADMNIAERFIPQDGHIQIQEGPRRIDIRVGTMPTIYGESIVLRLLEKGADILTPEQLGLDHDRAQMLLHMVEKPYGIFLTTGPTGCGKTTTLYSVLNCIYTPEKKILTIEDPVEYELPGVGQIPVRPKRGFTFASGLRSILRQDPDVVMVGEIRDSETAEIAIRAALTGHLVFSTLHTNDAAGAITRLVDMGIESFLISSSIEGVLAQRLVRKICSKCKKEYKLNSDVLKKLDLFEIEPGEGPHFHGSGCSECRGTGYQGRTGLFEILTVNPELRELITAKRTSVEITKIAMKNSITVKQDGVLKAKAGVTTFEEILRVALGGLA